MEFNTIEPLVTKEDFKNDTLYVTFTCSETNVSQDASVTVEKSASSKIMSSAGKMAKKELLRTAKRSLSRLIGSALGGGTAGRIGRNVTSSVISGAGGSSSEASSLKGEKRENAIVGAFEKVSSYFIWNKELNKWIGVQKDLMVPFFTQLENAPVSQRYDKIILARMLTEIAAADGNIDSNEKEFLSDFLPEEAGSVDDLLKRDTLTKVELEETSKGDVRDTMILLTWGLAFCDDELSSEEKERITSFAEMFDFDVDKQLELKNIAAQYIFDQMLTSLMSAGNFESNKSEIYDLAKKLDVSDDVAQKTEINFKKRNLLF